MQIYFYKNFIRKMQNIYIIKKGINNININGYKLFY